MDKITSQKSSHAVLDSFRHLVSLIHSASRESEKQVGLSAAQLYVLQKLRQKNHALSIKDLAALTHTHQSSVSVVVKKLIDKKLITAKSSASDARSVELRLAAKGKTLVDGSSEVVQDRLLVAIETLDESEQETLNILLGKVLDFSQHRKTPAAMFLEDDR